MEILVRREPLGMLALNLRIPSRIHHAKKSGPHRKLRAKKSLKTWRWGDDFVYVFSFLGRSIFRGFREGIHPIHPVASPSESLSRLFVTHVWKERWPPSGSHEKYPPGDGLLWRDCCFFVAGCMAGHDEQPEYNLKLETHVLLHSSSSFFVIIPK